MIFKIIGILMVTKWLTKILIAIVDTYNERKQHRKIIEGLEEARKTLARMQAKLDERNEKGGQ